MGCNKHDELWIRNGTDSRNLGVAQQPTLKIPNDVRKALKTLASQKKTKKRK